MLVHRRLPPGICLLYPNSVPVPIYTPVWRDALWVRGKGVLLKNTTQWFRLGHKPTLSNTPLSYHASHSGRVFNIVTTGTFHSIPFHSTFNIFDSVCIISSVFPEDKNQIVKRYVYSGTSGAASLQQFVEQNIYHRQGEMNFFKTSDKKLSYKTYFN